MEYSKDQLKAAYALNLCTVSVSQIIEYADVNIMEQEYEAILNNLNLEQMPKDEALLSILKQILDVITFFRIQDGDKKFIEKEYQQKMKNAIWAAVPNIGLIVAGGNPVTMAVSLASQVGIGYMNYRRAKADGEFEAEKQRWQLERTAIEQFNGLRRELFDTAWRLSATYGFPDQLRLTERQIRQYNEILMDNDLIRRHARLESISDAFLAYPPFWYQLSNTANLIAQSDLPISENVRSQYKQIARSAFTQYRDTNQHGLLREDPISASCALELADLLDYKSDKEQITDLLKEAIQYSGKANDTIQLCAISFLKLNEPGKAEGLLRLLVNEQYNTVLNAQLLSSIYVNRYIHEKSIDAFDKYRLLSLQVGTQHLYPMPTMLPVDERTLEDRFVRMQKQVLVQKYMLVFREFMEKYMVKYGRIIPASDQDEAELDDAYFLSKEEAIEYRKNALKRVFSDPEKTAYYTAILRDAGIPFKIIDLLNALFEACCKLNFMSETAQEILSKDIVTAISNNRDTLSSMQEKLNQSQFYYDDMCSLLDVNFQCFTAQFFLDFGDILKQYIDSRVELQDFAIAEQNLIEFCESEGLSDPNILFGKDGNDFDSTSPIRERRFSYRLLGKDAINASKVITNASEMTAIIKGYIPKVLNGAKHIEFYTRDDARLDRYFSRNSKISKNALLKSQTLAILDDLSRKDTDLLFTLNGIVCVKGSAVKNPVIYSEVTWAPGSKKELLISGRFGCDSINMDELYTMIQQLKGKSNPIPDSVSSLFSNIDKKELDFRFPGGWKPFGKK